MNSIAFPNIFKTTTTNVVKDHEASAQNLKLLLLSDRGSFFGDPYYGTIIKQLIFEPNNYILRDMLMDTIYTQLALFLPQVKIDRNSIEIIQDKERGKAYCRFSGINQIDYTHNTFNLLLFEDSDF
jgi:phage baseplate assembly protein W